MAIDSVGSGGGFDYAVFFSSSLAADTEDFEMAEVGGEMEQHEAAPRMNAEPDTSEIQIGSGGINFMA